MEELFLRSLHDAVKEGNFGLMKVSIENLKDKNPRSQDGSTLLHNAAQGGHLEIYKYIAGFADERNPSKNDGSTPLHEAAKNGYDELVKFILMVNLCQKILFLHQLTHNMMTDCSLNYKNNT